MTVYLHAVLNFISGAKGIDDEVLLPSRRQTSEEVLHYLHSNFKEVLVEILETKLVPLHNVVW